MAVQRQVGSQMDARPSTVDLRGKEFHFAGRDGAGVNLCGAGERACGIIQEGKDVGYHTSFATGNQLKVVGAAALAVDTRVASNANGQAVAAAGAAEVLGIVITASGAAGELVEIEFHPEGAGAAA